DMDVARATLRQWVDDDGSDREAIEMLCSLDEAAENWDGLIDSATRLARVSEGEFRVEAVVRLADACAKAGRPEEARRPMEEALEHNPDSVVVREHLKVLYERTSAWGELAAMTMYDVTQEED